MRVKKIRSVEEARMSGKIRDASLDETKGLAEIIVIEFY